MRGILVGLVFLGLAAPVPAGIYNTIESPPDLPPERVRSQVGQLRAVAQPPKGTLDAASFRRGYLRQAAQLEKEKADGTFSTVDRVNLGACYLRLGQVEDAIKLLDTRGPDRNHFLIQLNLASAHFMKGELELAAKHQEIALDQWPEVWSTFKFNQPAWYRKCELLFLRLLRQRLAESARGNKGELEVDRFFLPELRFVGPSGTYEAGALAQSIRDKLPIDAVGIALQMVLWYPQDMRLYWLLAELLNTAGHVQVAYEIVEELFTNRMPFKDLRQHRKVLEQASRLLAQFPLHGLNQTLNRFNQALLLAAPLSIPHGSLFPPGVGAAANAASTVAPMLPLPKSPMIGNLPDMGPTATPSVAPMPLFNWRHVTVGFAFGFLVAALLGFQWQEWRRRRSNDFTPPNQEP